MRKIKVSEIPKAERRQVTDKYNALIKEISEIKGKEALEIDSMQDFKVKSGTLVSYLKSAIERKQIFENIKVVQRKGLVYISLK